jgi:hypothetical protein
LSWPVEGGFSSGNGSVSESVVNVSVRRAGGAPASESASVAKEREASTTDAESAWMAMAKGEEVKWIE